MAAATKKLVPETPKTIAAREAIVSAREFLETVMDGVRSRVEGVSPLQDAGWVVTFTVFVSNPNLGAENGGLKREVLDELTFAVTLDADGAVRDMSKT